MDARELLDNEIEGLMSEMEMTGGGTENYSKMVQNLKTLVETRNVADKIDRNDGENGFESWIKRIDPNTVLSIGATFGLSVLMLYYEKTDIIKSKVFNIIPKIKF